MNRLLMGCGIAALVVVGALVTVITILIVRGLDERAGAEKASREAVLAIVTTWNEDELIKRGVNDFKTKETREKLDQVFAFYQRLGTFKSLGDGSGNVDTNYGVAGKLDGYTAHYSFPATFSADTATIEIESHKESSGWKILTFNVKSEAFIREAQPRAPK